MNKELPKIFRKNVDVSHCHNKKVYYANEDKIESLSKADKKVNISSLTTVEEKIRKLFKSSRYVFNINVLIKTDKKDYDTKIAGKVKNSLVTVDNEVIPIVEINDIIIKDRV